MSTIVFVVGMHRSGTSAFTRVLSLCGAGLPANLNPPADDNPTGYWEPVEAIQLNDAFLGAQGSTWYDPSPPARWEPHDPSAVADFEAGIAELLRACAGPAVVAIKDPRISLLMPYWTRIASDLGHTVKIVHVVRNPFEVARSLAARHHMAPGKFLALWIRYNLVAERDGRAFPRVFVTYGDLLANWRSVIDRCSTVLSLDLRSHEAQEAVGAFLSPELRHHVAADDGMGCPVSEELARRLFTLLRASARGEINLAEFDETFAYVLRHSAQLSEEATRESWLRSATLHAATAAAQAAWARLLDRASTLECEGAEQA